jgi:hypothetical protein
VVVGEGISSLRVDPERLALLGNQLVSAANGLPAAPEPFVETGTDELSQAIRDALPAIEDPIQAALPKLKTEATKTANNIVTAAGHYQRTDEQLAADYDAHRFDAAAAMGAGSAGGGAGAGGDAGSMGQLMGMPIQMASQAAQVPMQAMGALASVPQGVVQGVQQIGQMVGGGTSGGSGLAGGSGIDGPRDRADENRAREERERERQHEAAAGSTGAERAPVAQSPDGTVVPQQKSGRHAVPDPSVNL